jgi:sugar phosphate permease
MLGAAFSPRLMLAVGLMATSVINITFGFTTGVFWWTALWAMNGGLQVGQRPGCKQQHVAAVCSPYADWTEINHPLWQVMSP